MVLKYNGIGVLRFEKIYLYSAVLGRVFYGIVQNIDKYLFESVRIALDYRLESRRIVFNTNARI